MKNIRLTKNEREDYNNLIKPTIDTAPSGTVFFFPQSFSNTRSLQPRISRYMYEQTISSSGELHEVLELVGERARDGFRKI